MEVGVPARAQPRVGSQHDGRVRALFGDRRDPRRGDQATQAGDDPAAAGQPGRRR